MRSWSNLDVGTLLGRLTSFSARRAPLVVGVVVALSLLGALLALRLDPSASPSTFVDRDSEVAQATDDLHRKFGDEPIVILARGKLTGMLLTQDVAKLLNLEGCLSGNQPRGARTAAPVCRDFARDRPIQVVYGPGTFINEAAGQVLDRINFDRSKQQAEADRAARAARRVAAARGLAPADQKRLADAARQVVDAKYAQRALELAVRYGLNSLPALNSPDFVLRLVFEPSLGAETPKPRFSYLFPSSNAALIQARLRPGMSESERRETISMVRQAVSSKAFDLEFGTYIVSGTPVVAEGVASSISDELGVLLLVVVLVMAVTLMLVFRTRHRLLPLGLALAAAALTFGAMSVAGASLTIASIAVVPVLVGLAVDYAIQFQARYREEGSVEQAAKLGGPVIATAGAATAAGFLVLLLSPVPMVRGFGLLLVVGIVIAFAVTLTAGFAVLGGEQPAWMRRRLPHLPGFRGPQPRGGRVLSRHIPSRFGRLTGRARGAPPARWVASFLKFVRDGTRGLIAEARLVPPLFKRWGRGVFGVAVRRPGRVLRVALLLAVFGWIAGTQVEVVSDITRLVPDSQQEVRDLKTLQEEAGTSGDVNVLVRSERLLDPDVVRWMTQYQSNVLRRHGFNERRPCSQAELCPALSLTNLFGSGRQSARQVRQVDRHAAALLLAERDHRGPAHREHRVRHPHDAAGRAEAADRRHARATRPAARRGCGAGRPAGACRGCARRARGKPLVAVAGRARGGVPGPAGRIPPVRGGGGAADPDRARDRLVGAVPVHPADPAEPHVGDPRRAGDRDLDGVRGDPLGPLPRRARGAGWRRCRPCRGPTSAQAPRCSHPA